MKSALKSLLQGLGWLLIIVSGLTFLAGGKIISEIGKIDRILAEMLGLLIAAACGALGYVLKTAGEPDDVAKDQ